MSTTTIEWCIKPGTKPETWNPTTGCKKVSQGCKNCYAEVMHKRLMGMYPQKYNKPFLSGAVAHEDTLQIPYKWSTPRTVFVNSMSDLFHDNISFEFISNVFRTMRFCPTHTFIILTKRPQRMLEFFNTTNKDVLPNVWIGVSCENQETAVVRIPLLLEVPAAVRFLSCEPLLGKIDLLTMSFYVRGMNKINWVIAGGESGHHARPMHPDWARSLRDQCKSVGIPFFFKQWGEWKPLEKDEVKKYPLSKIQFDRTKCFAIAKVGKKHSGRLLDGVEHNEFPTLA